MPYSYSYYITSADFNQLLPLIGEDESFQISLNNTANAFDEGIYMLEYTIHQATTLSVEDLPNIAEHAQQQTLDKIKNFSFHSYAIVSLYLT